METKRTESAEDRVRTEHLGPTLRLVRKAQRVPDRWLELDVHLRGWLVQRARSRWLPPGVTAEDLAQDILSRTYEQLGEFVVTPTASFRGWLVTMLAWRAIDLRRRYLSAEARAGRQVDLDVDLLAVNRDRGQFSPHAICEHREDLELLDRAIDSLDAADRIVLRSYGLEGKSSDEVASELGYKNGNGVRGRYKRALVRLCHAYERLQNERKSEGA